MTPFNDVFFFGLNKQWRESFFGRVGGIISDFIISLEKIYPLKINGWKMKSPFEMVPVFGGTC